MDNRAIRSIVKGLNIHGFSGSTTNSGNQIAIVGDDLMVPLTGVKIQGDFIGTDISGTIAPDGLSDYSDFIATITDETIGVIITGPAEDNQICTAGEGTIDPVERNLISVLRWGVVFRGTVSNSGDTTSNLMAGNFVGTDRSGTDAVPNWMAFASYFDEGNRIEDTFVSGNKYGIGVGVKSSPCRIKLVKTLDHLHRERSHPSKRHVLLMGEVVEESPATLCLDDVVCEERLGGLSKHNRRAAWVAFRSRTSPMSLGT